MINADANACYGLLPEVKEAIRKFELDFSNPSSVHQGGQGDRALIEQARDALSDLMSLSDNQRIVFTSGATESNNQAINYAFWEHSANGKLSETHALSSSVEHPSVLETLRNLEKLGLSINLEDPKSNLSEKVQPETKLVSLMLANNETGEIFDVANQFARVKEASTSTITHTDAVQALGKINLDYSNINADLISISGHKIGALPGVGALIVSEDLEARPLLFGGPQEQRYRAGTENTMGIYTFGVAASVLKEQSEQNIKLMSACKEEIQSELMREVPDLIFNCHNSASLPNTLNIEVPGVLADDLVVAMDLDGIAISSGSACASGKPLVSHVLLALGKTEKQAKSTIRVSLRADCSATEKEQIVQSLVKNIKQMRSNGKSE